MCNNHNQANGKDAVILLTEARRDAAICNDRIAYLEGQVKSFRFWLMTKGKTLDEGNQIIMAIHNSTKRILDTDVHEEFIWSTIREGSHGLSDTMSGKDDCSYRMEDEQDQHGAYWGMHHSIAIKAEKRTAHLEGEEVFSKVLAFLDKVEEGYDASRQHPLPYALHQLVWKAKKKLDLHRFKLKTINYEQWAYLTNWMNVLLSVDKQFPCEAQNIGQQQYLKEDTLEDVAYEVVQVYYTHS